MTLRESLKAALDLYDQALEKSAMNEAQVDTLFLEAEKLVPNARLSELYFYGDRERSHDEIVEEALNREDIWKQGGELAVLLHVKAQLDAALADPNATITTQAVCGQALAGIHEELEELGYQAGALH